jgi:aminobenzoyl-glutamate transport protein
MNIGAVWLLIGLIIVTFIVDLIIPPRSRSGRCSRRSSSRSSSASASRRRRCSPPTGSATRPFNVITPLMAYFPLIVVFAQRYKKDAGIGTVVSLMLPYVVILSIAWTLFFVAWYLIGIPLGPGSSVHI